MTIPITRTKLILPRRKSEIITRRRLLDMLYDLMEYKLVIVAAPAGYGKTSLLIDFAHQSDLAVCWFSVDALDRDPTRFIAHFISAISVKFPAFGELSLAVLENSIQKQLDLEQIINTFVNEAVEHLREHVLLVIDDYHLVNSQKEISAFISRLIQEADENLHLILSSRGLLTLPDMPLMVARSLAGGLSFEELSFQSAEIQELMQLNYHQHLTQAAADQLAHNSEGWITGLLLSTETQQQGLLDRQRLSRVSGVSLYDYLVEQVLDLQTPDMQAFLLKTSMLEEFDVATCTAVLGDDLPWAALFNAALTENLFVLPVGEDGSWIRYHHLFRDFLQGRLEQDLPGEKNRILRQIGQYHMERKEWEAAQAVFQRLGDSELLVTLLEQAGQAMIDNNRFKLLVDWIDALPDEIVQRKPSLLYFRAIPEIIWGNTDKGVALLEKAEGIQRKEGDNFGLARSLARAAMAKRSLGQYSAALADAQTALDLTGSGPEWSKIKAEALRAVGSVLYYQGQVAEAISTFQQSLELFLSAGDRLNATALLMDLGVACQAAGWYQMAFKNFEAALEYWQDTNNTVRQASLLNNLGVVHHLTGNYEQAAAALEKALYLARLNKLVRIETLALCSLGDLFADLEAREAALDAYRSAREFSQRINYPFFLLYASVAMAACYRKNGNLDLARYYLNTVASRAEESRSAYEKGLYLLEAGCISLVEGKIQAAIDALEKSIYALDESGQPVEAARACLYLAQVYFSISAPDEAVRYITAAFDRTAQIESEHVLVVAGLSVKKMVEGIQNLAGAGEQAAQLYQRMLLFENAAPSIRKRLRARSPGMQFVPPRLMIYAFGNSRVEINASLVTVPEWQNQKKVREVFYFLLSHPGGLSKEEIGLTFWPDSSSSQLKMQFKNLIYRLRHALGPEVVVFDGDYYWFNRDLDYEYDVENFQNRLLDAHYTRDPEQKLASLKLAIRQYQGPFLPDAEGIWVLNIRQHLQETYFEAKLEAAQILFQQDNLSQALEYCQQIVEIDPCMEAAHRLAMQIYAAKGNRAGIYRQFEKCRLSLLKEINTLPSAQTISLFELLNQ